MFLNFNLRGLIATFVALLVGYWALMTFVPVPGIGAGHFGPDQNLANWIDANYLPGRLWDMTRDPEGLLSTLPAIGTCLLGVFAGMLLRDISAQAAAEIAVADRRRRRAGAGRPPLGAAIPDHQGDLDLVLRAGRRRL